MRKVLPQASKFRTLTVTIYRYRNLDLAVRIAKMVQHISVAAKNENNILLNTEDLREKINVYINSNNLTIFGKIILFFSVLHDVKCNFPLGFLTSFVL